MEYFRIQQDHRVEHPKFLNPSILNNIELEKYVSCKSDISKNVMGYTTRALIEHPTFIVAKELKDLFSAYQEGAQFFPFFTNDIDGKGLPYYVFRPLILDCLAEETEFTPNKSSIKKIVLDQSKIGSHKIFQIGGVLGRYLIVDLEILELALYNGIRPFLFTPVLLSEKKEVQ